MKKTIEKIFCDCCGNEMNKESNKYYFDRRKMNTLKLPYVYIARYPDEDGSDPVWGLDTYEINDICDDCIEKLLEVLQPITSQYTYQHNLSNC